MAIRFNSKEDRDYVVGFWGKVILMFFLCAGGSFLAQYLDEVTGIDRDVWVTIFWCFFGLIIFYYLYRKGKLNKILQIVKKIKSKGK